MSLRKTDWIEKNTQALKETTATLYDGSTMSLNDKLYGVRAVTNSFPEEILSRPLSEGMSKQDLPDMLEGACGFFEEFNESYDDYVEIQIPKEACEDYLLSGLEKENGELTALVVTKQAIKERVIKPPFPNVCFTFGRTTVVVRTVPEGYQAFTITLRKDNHGKLRPWFNTFFTTIPCDGEEGSKETYGVLAYGMPRWVDEPSHKYGHAAVFFFSLAMTILFTEKTEIKKEPLSKANVNRLVKGLRPLHPTHKVVIDRTVYQSVDGDEGTIEGSKRRPRMHRRRGHIRRLPSGQKTFVKHCWVAAHNTGAVTSTYVVR